MYAERTTYDKYIPQNRQYCKGKGAGNISHNVSLQFRSFQKFFNFKQQIEFLKSQWLE